MIKLHNTLTRSTEEFRPLSQPVGLYSCGPTVYDHQTIGNWTSYIRWDILARTIRQSYKLSWYMNITDVGHLVSDADEGEDKLQKSALLEGKTAWQVAEQYTQEFIKGLDELNISIDRGHLVKATDHIQEQIELVQKLEDKGYTYIIDDGVYFDSTKFADYGKMAKLDITGLQAGARVDIGQKQNATDFALWKFTPKDQKRDMEWDSPWGKGFPGWHIECSAMAMKYLGETFDIHTGGIDHIPVHHTNEIAQSEAATGKQFVRYWLHSNFLQVDSTKIAKSLGNGYSLHDLAEKGFSGMDFRMFALQSNYQKEANFSWEDLSGAKNRLKDLQAVSDLRFQLSEDAPDKSKFIETSKSSILDALQDNLNTPQALSYLSQFGKQVEDEGISPKNKEQFESFIKWIDESLGFKLADSADINDEQKKLIAQRTEAREAQDWNSSDSIRDRLLEHGIALNDTPRGVIWYRK